MPLLMELSHPITTIIIIITTHHPHSIIDLSSDCLIHYLYYADYAHNYYDIYAFIHLNCHRRRRYHCHLDHHYRPDHPDRLHHFDHLDHFNHRYHLNYQINL
jgi:hypothetical protein